LQGAVVQITPPAAMNPANPITRKQETEGETMGQTGVLTLTRPMRSCVSTDAAVVNAAPMTSMGGKVWMKVGMKLGNKPPPPELKP